MSALKVDLVTELINYFIIFHLLLERLIGRVTLEKFSCNLSRNFVATQIARKAG